MMSKQGLCVTSNEKGGDTRKCSPLKIVIGAIATFVGFMTWLNATFDVNLNEKIKPVKISSVRRPEDKENRLQSDLDKWLQMNSNTPASRFVKLLRVHLQSYQVMLQPGNFFEPLCWCFFTFRWNGNQGSCLHEEPCLVSGRNSELLTCLKPTPGCRLGRVGNLHSHSIHR